MHTLTYLFAQTTEALERLYGAGALFLSVATIVLQQWWLTRRMQNAMTAGQEAVRKEVAKASAEATKDKDAVATTAAGVAEKTEAVRQDLEKSTAATATALADIKQTGLQTHGMANSARGEQLRLIATLKELLAAQTGRPEDAAAAAVARADADAHAATQARLERPPGAP